VELWQAAVEQFPDIVEQHGEFSGQLLQAMLGVEVVEPRRLQAEVATEFASASASPKASRSAGNGILRYSLSSSNHLPANDHIALEEKKYLMLAPEVQGIIAAGKLGCPVKSCRDLNSLMPRPLSGSNLFGSNHLAESQNPIVDNAIEFERDVAQMELEQLESTTDFEYPNARLERSMRRCDRKLLPLLDKWSPFDVVLTKHEIVFIGLNSSSEAESDIHFREVGRRALMATKGGKGLRLIDVTAGRRVVAHQPLADILSVYVEREQRHEGTNPRSADEVAKALNNHGHAEFWQDPPETDCAESGDDKETRWESVHQDALRIETKSGILYLRFYSDLEDSEAHPGRAIDELDAEQPVYKDIALQWAQTIVRKSCHSTQLNQEIPHFGTSEKDELRDLLLVVPKEEKIGHRRPFYRAKGHRRLRPASRRTANEKPALSREDVEQGNSVAAASTNGDHPLRQSTTTTPTSRKKFARFATFHVDLEGREKTLDDAGNRALSSR
jgi:hypothetical protein